MRAVAAAVPQDHRMTDHNQATLPRAMAFCH
jgi:hypothetical protein